MRKYNKKNALTITELLVVIAIMALLTGIGVPAVKQALKSFESAALTKSVISAALSTSRAYAMKNQKYAGVRFQQNKNGDQYMIFIVNDNSEVGPLIPGNLGFHAVIGRKPMKIGSTAGVMDLKIKTDYSVTHPMTTDGDIKVTGDDPASDANIDEDKEVLDATTFSILFSPSGKLIQHTLKVAHGTIGGDIFNIEVNVNNGIGIFIEDENDNPVEGLQIELSRKSFIIYDKREFAGVNKNSRWSNYLQYLDVLYVNPHSGEIVGK